MYKKIGLKCGLPYPTGVVKIALNAEKNKVIQDTKKNEDPTELLLIRRADGWRQVSSSG
jgi:hypothetical protein